MEKLSIFAPNFKTTNKNFEHLMLKLREISLILSLENNKHETESINIILLD